MKLNVVKSGGSPQSPDALWGRYLDILFDYAEAVAEFGPVELAYGRGLGRKDQPGLLLLPIGVAESDFVPAMQNAFVAAHSLLPRVFEPGEATIGSFLSRYGYRRREGRLFRLRSAAFAVTTVDGLLVVPTRAAMAAFEQWCRQRAGDEPGVWDQFNRLDDPHYESILALRDGNAVGSVGLQTRGQTGLVADLFVQPEERLSGIGSMLLGRALELSARSQLADVFAAVIGDDQAPPRLLEKAGFAAVREFNEWLPPKP